MTWRTEQDRTGYDLVVSRWEVSDVPTNRRGEWRGDVKTGAVERLKHNRKQMARPDYYIRIALP